MVRINILHVCNVSEKLSSFQHKRITQHPPNAAELESDVDFKRNL